MAVPIFINRNEMDLPPIDKSLLAQCGIALPTMPLQPVADYGVRVKTHTPRKERSFDCIEALKLFTPSEAVKMNYIPQMLIALALEQTTTFINYCVGHKISDLKKYTRVLRECVEEYAKGLRDSYFDAWNAYVNYVNIFTSRVEIDMVKTWFTIGNVANKKISDSKWRDTATHITIIRELLDYAERFDKKMDKVIAEKMKEPVRRKQDKMLQAITIICIALEEEYGLRLTPDSDVNLCIGVLANKASLLADEIIHEELNVSKS
jgi:hypothetical protein